MDPEQSTENSLSLNYQQDQGENQNPTSELSDFGNQFIQNIPEQDREVVAKYVKDWDGNVTKKFQEYSAKLKPYEEMGDPETLSSAYQVLQGIQENPVTFFEDFKSYLLENADVIQERYGIDNLEQALGAVQQMQEEYNDDNGGLPEYEGLPPAVAEKLQNLERGYEEATSKLSKFEASQQEKEQMQMLDAALEDMHNKHGDFDDGYVLSQIASGKSPDEAIKAFEAFKESVINSQGNKPPDLLNGPAGTPLDQVDRTKLRDPKFRKEVGVEFLKRSLQS